jgi:hypothetical protein
MQGYREGEEGKMTVKIYGLSDLAQVILILGGLYFGYEHGFSWWLTGILILAIFCWSPDQIKIIREEKKVVKVKKEK